MISWNLTKNEEIRNVFCTSTLLMCSNAIGRNNEKDCIRYFKFNIIISCCFQIFLVSLFYLLSDQVFYLYTSNEEIIKSLRQVTIIACLSSVMDNISYVLSSINKSCRKLYQTTTISILCQIFLQMLLMYLVAFIGNLKLIGIWLSNLVSLTTQAILYFAIFKLIKFKDVFEETNTNLKIDYLNIMSLDEEQEKNDKNEAIN